MVIKSNLLHFRDFAIAPAAVSPFILYVWLFSPKPNGDTAAMAIAKSLKARRLLLMTNVDGVLNKEKKLIEEISSTEILEMIKNETITEGMIPKINACLDAVNNGVTAVGIINGTKKHSCLWEIFSDKGAGTLIRKWKN